MKLVMAALRSFLVFLKDEQLIEFDIRLITSIKPAMRRKVLPAYTHEEASAILTSVNRETGLGKRDYAILLLAKKTGIRTIDIANLRFDNLDWQNNTINIIQHKTGRALSLPLAPDVGNAIAEYILNDRPDIQSNYIFLKHKAPYAKLCERGSLGHIVNKYMKLGEVDNSGRKGFHSFRRSVATSMLETETPITTICQVLGQVKPDSIKPYLSLNDQKLRFCALDLQGIEVMREDLL